MHTPENKTFRGVGWIALAGAAAWCGLMAVQPPGWAQGLFLLAPLVAVPLTLPLFGASGKIQIAFTASAFLLIPAFVLERGVPAAACTVPWLLLCVGLAVVECARWRRLDLGRVLTAGYLAVGGGCCWRGWERGRLASRTLLCRRRRCTFITLALCCRWSCAAWPIPTIGA